MMTFKNLKSVRRLFIVAIASIFIFAYGCGSGTGNDDDDETSVQTSSTSGEAVATNVQLEIGVPVDVNAGDQLVPASSDTRIRLTHVLNFTKQVTLLAGSAELIRGDFQIL